MSHQHLQHVPGTRLIRTMPDTARAVAVRTAMVGDDLHARLLEGARLRATTFRDDGERGSQTAEYAMVGGVGAAAAGALIACIKNKDVLERVMESVLTALFRSIRSWF
jgi:hypothetical protein